jgi:hypothetical protein
MFSSRLVPHSAFQSMSESLRLSRILPKLIKFGDALVQLGKLDAAVSSYGRASPALRASDGGSGGMASEIHVGVNH